jgi:mRNA turnover protein 4
VNLTQTEKKGRVRKIKLVDDVRSAIDKYEHLYTFTTHNMRNTFLKELRQSMSDSR